MKSALLGAVLLCLVLTSCSSDHHTYHNPNLLNVTVNFTVNLSLPQFNPLQFSSNPVYVNGYGNAGIIVMKTGADTYVAFDAADPNHPYENCSKLHIEGVKGVCQCSDHNTYNLFTGTAIEDESGGDSFEYTMKQYQVIDEGNGLLRIKN